MVLKGVSFDSILSLPFSSDGQEVLINVIMTILFPVKMIGMYVKVLFVGGHFYRLSLLFLLELVFVLIIPIKLGLLSTIYTKFVHGNPSKFYKK